MMLLMIFAVFKWRESKKQQAIISEQKFKVEQQKELIEEKNKDITDSMIYASSIQQAIITSEEYIANMFKEFFVYYKPRDIVSGDFYWAHQTSDGKKLIAVGDCTGHGVPGAMMSMLGSAFLNEIVIEGKEFDPGKILDKMRSPD
jgi:serine phosphatase RsbU (regulator of sigma subunit)